MRVPSLGGGGGGGGGGGERVTRNEGGGGDQAYQHYIHIATEYFLLGGKN